MLDAGLSEAALTIRPEIFPSPSNEKIARALKVQSVEQTF